MSTQALKAVANGGKELGPVAQMSSFLDKLKPQIALALPKHLNPDRMCRLALTQFSSNRSLQACSPQSIAASIVTASQMGLEIGVTGQGFLVPYKTTCQFVPGWQGLVDLLSRAGRATAWTGAVFEGDEFDYQLGDSPFVRHRPGVEDDPARLRYVYSVGRVNGSQWPVIEVWPIAKVWKHRDKFNKVGGQHYSFRNPEMYARKVPLLQVLKYMPKSIELSMAIQSEHAANTGAPITLDGNFVTMPADDEMDGNSPTPPPAKPEEKPEVAATPDETPPAQDEPGQSNGDPARPDVPAHSFAQVSEMLNRAKTVDDLDTAATAIETVASLGQRKELSGIYRKMRDEMESRR